MIKNKTSQKGFTLIELLISISIFIVFLGILSSSYVSIVRSQRHANAVRRMYSEVRTFMDVLAEDVRLSMPNYDCYKTDPNAENDCPSEIATLVANTPNQSSYMVLLNKDRSSVTAYRFNSEKKFIQVKKYLKSNNQWLAQDDYQLNPEDPSVDGEGFRQVLSSNIQVKNASFGLYPAKNPYLAENASKNQYQFQPQYSVFLGVENSNPTLPPFKLDLQTSFSSRVYSRK